MKDIFLKRNELRKKSSHLREMRFEPSIKSQQVDTIAKEQNKIYNHWNFYDKFLKAREEVKNEVKSSDMGKAK